MRVLLRWALIIFFTLSLLFLHFRIRNFRSSRNKNVEIDLYQKTTVSSSPVIYISHVDPVKRHIHRKQSVVWHTQPLDCVINGYSLSGCYLINRTHAAVDFGHVKNLYEVSGYLDAKNGRLVWDQSTDKLRPLHDEKYHHLGIYLNSAHGETEKRMHLKLVTADSNVPISSQWNQSGYYYPIQISQFGLNYFSQYKLVAEFLLKKSNSKLPTHSMDILNVLSDIDPILKNSAFWECDSSYNISTKVCQFGITKMAWPVDVESSISFLVKNMKQQVNSRQLNALLLVGTNLKTHFRLILHLRAFDLIPYLGIHVELHYTCSSFFGAGESFIRDRWWAIGFSVDSNLKVVYFLPNCNASTFSENNITLARNLLEDIRKSFTSVEKVSSFRRSPISGKLVRATGNFSQKKIFSIHVLCVKLSGSEPFGGVLSQFILFHRPNVSVLADESYSIDVLLATERFLETRFLAAANWLLSNQHPDGSWRVDVRRNFTADIFLTPGWCSAMGQGQAISLLVRIFGYTGQDKYLKAAARAVAPFTRLIRNQTPSTFDDECAVKTHFLDQESLSWYEEYPVHPHLFVLNGFIFSLIGLFDLSQCASVDIFKNESIYEEIIMAAQLFDNGIATLVKLLPLFDSGSGSFYDLRHLSFAFSLRSGTPPKLHLSNGRPDMDRQHLLDLLRSGPNRARWQYHNVHLQLLQILTQVSPQHTEIWRLVYDRWLAYSFGFRSHHN